MRLVLAFSVCVGLSVCYACKTTSPANKQKEEFNRANDPLGTFGIPSTNFSDYVTGKIPSAAKLNAVPWASNYWPIYKGGISDRWQSNGSNANNGRPAYANISSAQAPKLTTEEIAKLSPSEKYDLANGKFDFPLTLDQQKRTKLAADGSGGTVPTWFGICHGWAPASALSPRPGVEAKIKNSSGQCVTFYRADIEALLSQSYADAKYRKAYLGQRCNKSLSEISRDSNGRIVDAECRDSNPGAFHVVLTRMISQNKPVILDIVGSDEVWNHPVFSYQLTLGKIVPSDGAAVRAPGTKFIVPVQLSVNYV